MRNKFVVTTAITIMLPFVAYASGSQTSTDTEILNRDDLWVLLAAALVFFMQAGFKVLETGLVKQKHRASIGAKNLLDWVAGSLAFFLFGFGLMFGHSINGLIGIGFVFGEELTLGKTFIFFLFQLAFAGTALTIVSGAMSGRTSLTSYFVASLATATFIYPIVGHWVWGDILYTDNSPWLSKMGFMDFAGSTVVHSVGAWVGLIGIWVVGPRMGRYNIKGQVKPIKSSDYSYSILGVMILWLGWWGFNGGSTLAFNADVPKIILNTNLAAAAACATALFHCIIFQRKENALGKIIGGTLTGLVSITASCNVVSPQSSLIIGAIAGVIHNISYVLIEKKWRLDDPVGAIAVHGFGGIFGTLSVALFGKQELLALPWLEQLGVQTFGILMCFAFTSSISLIMFLIIKRTIGLRVSPQQENSGSFFEENTHPLKEVETEIEDNTLHHISAKISNRGYNVYTVKEYLGLSIDFRSTWEASNKILYLNEEGYVIKREDALKQLKAVQERAGKTIKKVRVN